MRYIEGFQNRAIETSSSLVVENCFFSDLIHGGIILKSNGITVNLSLSCFIDVINDDFGACLASKFPIHDIKTYFDKIIFRCCFTNPKEKETTESQTVSIRCNQGENILLMAFISTSHCGLNNDSYDRRGIVDLAGINSQLSNINMTDSSENSQSLYCGSELHGATLNAKFMTMTRLFSKASMYVINSNSSFLYCNIIKLNCTKYPISCTGSTASFIKCCIINNYNQQVSAKKSTIIIDSCYIVNVSFPELRILTPK